MRFTVVAINVETNWDVICYCTYYICNLKYIRCTPTDRFAQSVEATVGKKCVSREVSLIENNIFQVPGIYEKCGNAYGRSSLFWHACQAST